MLRYMKVDVEGIDLECISSLAEILQDHHHRPKFFSIELPQDEKVLDTWHAHGRSYLYRIILYVTYVYMYICYHRQIKVYQFLFFVGCAEEDKCRYQ